MFLQYYLNIITQKKTQLKLQYSQKILTHCQYHLEQAACIPAFLAVSCQSKLVLILFCFHRYKIEEAGCMDQNNLPKYLGSKAWGQLSNEPKIQSSVMRRMAGVQRKSSISEHKQITTCSLGRFRESPSFPGKGKHPREVTTTIKLLFNFSGDNQT